MKKESIKRKGVCRVYDDDSVEFQPYAEGKPIQKDAKKVRKSTLYSTEGEENSVIMHLKVDGKSADPAAELAADFEKLIKNIDPKREGKPRGKILDKGEGYEVYLNKAAKTLEVRIKIELDENRSYKDDFYRTNFEIQKCFTCNKQLIQSALK